MREIKYLCTRCGRGQHGDCLVIAFYELATDVRTGQQIKTAVHCECPHLTATRTSAARGDAT